MRLRRATRAQLAGETGLSTMTIGKLLADMETCGEVERGGTARAGSGRPSTIACYRSDYAYFAAITVEQKDGKSAFTMCIHDLFGDVAMREKMLLDHVDATSFDGFFDQAITRGFRIALAVFVLPGVAEGERIVSCDLQALAEGQLLRRIRSRFGVEVLFENDVNAAVYGHAFSENGGKVYAGMYFPRNYCPGAGAVIGGEILRGSRHFAGEIGNIHGESAWMTLDYDDTERTAEMIAQMLVVYACTIAPAGMVLYGDFFTVVLRRVIRERFEAQMHGRFDMKLSYRTSMAGDMETGAMRLGLEAMLTLLDENTGRTRG